MDRRTEEKLNELKFYVSEGDFWRDLWRVFIPVGVVAVVAVIFCMP